MMLIEIAKTLSNRFHMYNFLFVIITWAQFEGMWIGCKCQCYFKMPLLKRFRHTLIVIDWWLPLLCALLANPRPQITLWLKTIVIYSWQIINERIESEREREREGLHTRTASAETITSIIVSKTANTAVDPRAQLASVLLIWKWLWRSGLRAREIQPPPLYIVHRRRSQRVDGGRHYSAVMPRWGSHHHGWWVSAYLCVHERLYGTHTHNTMFVWVILLLRTVIHFVSKSRAESLRTS